MFYYAPLFKELQIKALAEVMKGNPLFLLTHTGSGKTLVAEVALSMLREVKKKPKGVIPRCEPMNSVIEDKLRSGRGKWGSISQGGKKTVILDEPTDSGDSETDGEMEGDTKTGSCVASFTVTDISEGKIDVIILHAESIHSEEGEQILISDRQ